jgi:Fe-S cluster assembly protein SufD
MMNQTINDAPAYTSLRGLQTSAAAQEPAWLRELRNQAASVFAELGLPSPQDEDWRFTPLSEFAKHEFQPVASHEASVTGMSDVPESFGGWRAVLVNGRLNESLSRLPSPSDGLTVLPLSAALEKCPALVSDSLGKIFPTSTHPFVALNTAHFADILFVHVTEGTVVDRPLEIVSWIQSGAQSPIAVFPRVLVIAEPNSQLTLIEVHAGSAQPTYLTSPVVEIEVRQGARVDHYRVQNDSSDAFHFAAAQSRVKSGARYELFSIAMGGKLSRADLRITFAEPHGEGLLYGLYRTEGEQLADLHSVIDHASPYCSSWEVVKGILEGRSRGVFNGRIIVRPGAQKTDAKQTNRNLLLSRDAVVNANPQLEIYADDVKCTHGATVGHLDEQALFYLRSRGVKREDAQALLTYAFANDILRLVDVTPLRQWLELRILEVEHVAFDKDLLEVK